MATTAAAKKRKPTSTKSTSTAPTQQEVTLLKTANCPSLSRTGTIGYEISADDTGAVLFRLTSNSGAGYFNNKVRVSFDDVLDALKAFEKQFPITSLAMKDVYPAHSSINNWSFLTAVLLAEGVVETHPDHPRRYRLCKNPDAFLSSLDKQKATHSVSAKPKPKAKAKAPARMPKGKSKPAVGE
jgi:hypothetical protein